MPEIPRHQILDAVGHGDGDVRGIRRSFARNGPKFNKLACQFLRVRGGVQERNALEHLQTVAGSDRVACARLGQDQFRRHQIESLGGVPPPLARHFLVRSHDDLP